MMRSSPPPDRFRTAGRGFRPQVVVEHDEDRDCRLAAVEMKGFLYYRRGIEA